MRQPVEQDGPEEVAMLMVGETTLNPMEAGMTIKGLTTADCQIRLYNVALR